MDIVLDLGQSGARVKIGEEILSYPIAKQTSESVPSAVERVLQQLPQSEFDRAYLSLTGLLGNVGDVEPFGELCYRYFGTTEVFVMDDGLAAYFGALGKSNGVVLTIGGGVVAVSGNNGKFGHADGKGQIFGDLGGGFWVGQAGMRRALATLDGRDSAHDLVELLATEINAHDALANKTSVDAATLCIKAAATVAQGADKGNVSALQILEEGAEHLGDTVVAAWRKVSNSPEETPEIAFLGGLSQSTAYVNLIQQGIRNQLKSTFVQRSFSS
jgi:N-acetylglucosamine kinase-like BadF-type ATPase